MPPGAGRPLLLGKLEAALSSLAAAITIPFVVPYAVNVGANAGQIGLVTALPLLVFNLAQIPAARWGARSGHPRRFFLLAGGLGPLVWPIMALLMLSDRATFPILLAVTTAAAVSTGLLSPVWTAFLAEHVPTDGRGGYFGTRNLVGGIATLAGTALASYLASQSGFARGYGVALLLAAAALCGALIAQTVAVGSRSGRWPREPAHERDPESWQLPAVRRYAAYGSLLIMGAGMATPFYSVFFIQRLQGTPETATTLIAVANAVAMLAQGLWGRIIDRRGIAPVANGSLAVIAALPLLWLAATAPLLAAPIWLLNGLAWAACNIANLSVVLAISNERNRASVVAWLSVFQAPSDFAAPLIGGFLADRLDLPAVFLISSAVRLAAWGVFLRGFSGATEGQRVTPLRTSRR
jgi:MFS family permease